MGTEQVAGRPLTNRLGDYQISIEQKDAGRQVTVEGRGANETFDLPDGIDVEHTREKVFPDHVRVTNRSVHIGGARLDLPELNVDPKSGFRLAGFSDLMSAAGRVLGVRVNRSLRTTDVPDERSVGPADVVAPEKPKWSWARVLENPNLIRQADDLPVPSDDENYARISWGGISHAVSFAKPGEERLIVVMDDRANKGIVCSRDRGPVQLQNGELRVDLDGNALTIRQGTFSRRVNLDRDHLKL